MSDEDDNSEMETAEVEVPPIVSMDTAETVVAKPKGKHGGRRDGMRIWTADEDKLLLELYSRMGTNWKEIAREMSRQGEDPSNPRNTAMVRNRYMRICKGRNEIMRGRADNTRGVFNRCTKCGAPKKGHTCPVAGGGDDDDDDATTPPAPTSRFSSFDTMPYGGATGAFGGGGALGYPNLSGHLTTDLERQGPLATAQALSGRFSWQINPTMGGQRGGPPAEVESAQTRQNEVESALNSLCDAYKKISTQQQDEQHLFTEHMPHLLMLLKVGPLTRKAKAAGVVANLSSEHNIALVKAGAIPLLVLLLSYGPSSDAAKNAAAALSKLAANNEGRGDAIEEEEAIPALVELLSGGDEATAAKAAKSALESLAGTSEERKEKIDKMLAKVKPPRPKEENEAAALLSTFAGGGGLV